MGANLRLASFLAPFFQTVIFLVTAHAQTTQGLISGRVSDSDGNAIADATVTADSLETSTHVTGKSNPDGFFVLPLLPPGRYRVRVDAPGYQVCRMSIACSVSMVRTSI